MLAAVRRLRIACRGRPGGEVVQEGLQDLVQDLFRPLGRMDVTRPGR